MPFLRSFHAWIVVLVAFALLGTAGHLHLAPEPGASVEAARPGAAAEPVRALAPACASCVSSRFEPPAAGPAWRADVFGSPSAWPNAPWTWALPSAASPRATAARAPPALG